MKKQFMPFITFITALLFIAAVAPNLLKRKKHRPGWRTTQRKRRTSEC